MEVLDDSPCNGICRMKDNHCISCGRDYEDLAQWLYMSREARLDRMEQLKRERDANIRRNIKGIAKNT